MSNPVLDQVRSRVRAAVARETLPGRAPMHPGRFAWQGHAGASVEERVGRFTRELEPLGGRVHRAASMDAARETVLALVSQHGTGGVLAWPDEEIGLPGLSHALQLAGARVVDPRVGDGQEREQRLAGLGACTVGITGADYGLADTGSLVLANGPGRGRLASLLPPAHVAVLPVARLVWTLDDALVASPGLATSGSNLVVITGPSRTADIEMTLSRGVHGPRDVHVVLVG